MQQFLLEQRISWPPQLRVWLGALLVSWALSGLGGASACGATFVASLDRDTITLGESATLSLAFGGGTPEAVPTPQGIQNLRIAYLGPSSQFSVINGQVSSSVTYNFTLTPQKPGDYTIPAIAAEVGGEKLTSQPLLLKATAPTAPSPQAMKAGSEPAFLKLVVPRKEVYAGEAFTVEVQLYVLNGIRLNHFQFTAFPAEGFNVGKMAEGQHRQTQLGNSVYTVIPVSVALTAVKAGPLVLGPVTASVVLGLPNRDTFDVFGMFGEQRQVSLATESEKLPSLPVPRQNMPSDYTGAVGVYTMSRTAGPTNVAEGDPITVRVQIAGRGSLDSLRLPEQSWQGFKVYAASNRVEAAGPLGLQGAKVFEQIVQPESSAIKALPPFTFSFFDPDQKAFRTLTEPAIALQVRSSGATPVPAVLSQARKAQDNAPTPQDIVPNKQRLGEVAQIGPPLVQRPWFLALQSVPLLAFVSTVAWRKRVEKLANNPKLRRHREVAQLMREGQATLRRLASENKSDEFFATLFRLLQEQVGDTLDLPASSITEAVVEERLRPQGVRASTLASLQELFQTCNLARYAPLKGSQELAAVIPKFEAAVVQLKELS